MAWLILMAASVVEILMGLSLKYADGWTRPVPSIVGIVTALGSVYLLTHAMKDLPAGTAYAAWTGIGSAGTTPGGRYSALPLPIYVCACGHVNVIGSMAAMFPEGRHRHGDKAKVLRKGFLRVYRFPN